MPHAGFHLVLARRSIEQWRARNASPFDIDDSRALNAFLHGSLAPDMGHFPGCDPAFGRAVHTRRTGDTMRTLLGTARTEAERAFAWGWLTHVLSDVLVHPLVNEDAARRRHGDVPHIIEHVRVEAGLDVWFGAQDAGLGYVRLQPAFDVTGYRFLADTFDTVLGIRIPTRRLVAFERRLMLCTRIALHVATDVARRMWWKDVTARRAPILSSIAWHAASRAGTSMMRSYLRPHIPDTALVHRVERAIATFDQLRDEHVANRAAGLPDYNLEKGGLISDSAGVQVA